VKPVGIDRIGAMDTAESEDFAAYFRATAEIPRVIAVKRPTSARGKNPALSLSFQRQL
jgi:hypothetical protein